MATKIRAKKGKGKANRLIKGVIARRVIAKRGPGLLLAVEPEKMTAASRAIFLIQSGQYLTQDEKPLYLFASEQQNWILPIFRSPEEALEVDKVMANSGANPDATATIFDAIEFIKTAERKHKGFNVVLAVKTKFTDDGGGHWRVHYESIHFAENRT